MPSPSPSLKLFLRPIFCSTLPFPTLSINFKMKSSASGASLSRPSSSRSKPGTPKARSRSKAPDREFILWIPEPLDDLENIIQSKQRTLDLLNYQTETLDKEVQDQLLARDRYISELNRTILDLKSAMKSRGLTAGTSEGKNFEKEIENQEQAGLELRKENSSLSARLRKVEDEYRKARKSWEEERESLEIMNNALIEEEEGLKGSLEAKESETYEMAEAIKILQSAVERLTRLNSDLLSNVDKVNSEIQALNIKYYEANVKAVRAVELQKTIDEYIDLNYNQELKNAKLLTSVDSLGRFIKVSEWVMDNLQNIEEHTKSREAALAKASADNVEKELLDIKLFLNDTINNTQAIRQSIKKNIPVISPEDKTSEDILRSRNAQLENDLKKTMLTVKDFHQKESAYLEEIDGLKHTLEQTSLDYKNYMAKMKNQLDIMKDVEEKFNARIENFRTENEKNLADLYTTKAKFAHLTGKQEHFQKKRKELQESEDALQTENNELKNKLMIYNNDRQRTIKGSSTEEIRMKKAMSQLQILRDELFKKDTALVKKAREMIKLENEIESQKTNVQKLHSKMKTIESEIIGKVSLDLEDKDRQIEILKEMLRCAHSDIKLKDGQINSIKNADRMTSPKRK